jgi:hypothetical protein
MPLKKKSGLAVWSYHHKLRLMDGIGSGRDEDEGKRDGEPD